ncbi:MAG TPA: MerR family transcriptional regulator [Kineosporiaceae bacterium]|nr:MerR family transcriptional regulator [Kineosporiaceae bacterium]
MKITENSWSVGDVARLAGVTVRALHHYDRIGLLRPSVRSSAGYRGYHQLDLARLQRILAYRELGFALEDIARLLDDPDSDPVARLRHQHDLVLERIERLRQIAAVLERTMEAHTMGIKLTAEEMLEVFGEHDPTQYADEVQERWGDTDAYQQSKRRTSSYTKDDWIRIKAEQEATGTRLAEVMAAGLPADSPQAMAAAEAHRLLIDRYFYDLSREQHVGLAEMYLADPRFRKTYEDVAPGLAQYVHDAIVANAQRQPNS